MVKKTGRQESAPSAKPESFKAWRDRLENKAAEIGDLSMRVPNPGAEVFVASLEDNVRELGKRLAVLRHRMVEPEAVRSFEKIQSSLDDLSKFLNISRISRDFREELEKSTEGFHDAVEKISDMIADLEEKYQQTPQ